MKFFYKARDIKGNLISDVGEADSLQSLLSSLAEKGLFVVSVEEVKRESEEKIISKESSSLIKFSFMFQRITLLQLAVFFRQLSTMINAGVPVVSALEDLSSMTLNLKFRNIISKMAKDIKGGKDFSSALKEHKKVFSNLIVSMVKAGEETGKLGEILRRISKHLEGQIKLRNKVKSAMTYPVVVFTFLIGVLCVVLFGLVPKFEEMYASFGAQLPQLTQLVVGISRLMIRFSPLIILFIIISITVFIFLYRNNKLFRFYIDDLKLRIPILGKIFLKIILARFCSTLGTLISSGIPIVQSLEIVSGVVNHLPLQEILQKIRGKIIGGESLSNEMSKYSFFPKMDVRMIKVGEETGKIDEMLNHIYDYYSEEVDNTISSLTSIIEPVLIVGIGIVVGIVVVALYLPIFKLASAMTGG